MEIKVIRQIEALGPYLDEWNDILEENGNDNPYITPDWIIGWWRFFGNGRLLYIIVLYDRERAIGFLPLMGEKKRLYIKYRIIGCPHAARPWV